MTPEGDVTMETLEKTWLDREIEKGVTGHARWVDRMIEKGIAEHAPWADRLVEQAVEQGTLQSKREAVRRVVRVKLGVESAEFDARLAGTRRAVRPRGGGTRSDDTPDLISRIGER